MRYEYALPEGTATLSLSGDNITQEDVEDIYAWLDVMKRTILRTVRQRDVTPATTVPAEQSPQQELLQEQAAQ